MLCLTMDSLLNESLCSFVTLLLCSSSPAVLLRLDA